MDQTRMKLVVMLVPDAIIQLTGTRNKTSQEKLRVDKHSLIKVLGPQPDYHFDYYFDDIDRVRILAIEDMPVNPERA